MSLTFEELGISEDEWDILAESMQKAIYAVDLYQWTPEFTINDGDNSGFPDFDAINFNDDVYRVNSFYLDNSVGHIESYVPPSDPVIGIPLSLAVTGGQLVVFAVTINGIEANLYTVSGGTWSGWGTVVERDDVKFIAATNIDCVHYVTYDEGTFLYQLHVVTCVGSTWTEYDSDIYWGYQINSFAARQKSNGHDVLVLASDSPGIQSVSVVGTTITKKLMPSGGIYTFIWKNGMWSDHNEVDHIDQWSSFRYRNQVRLSQIDDVFWMTCYSSDGTVDHPITGYRYYTSVDGIHWSRGELLKLPDEVSIKGIILLAKDATVYAFTYGMTYTAKRTLLFGSPHSDTQLSLQGRLLGLSLNRQDMQQINIRIDNRRDWLANTFVYGTRTLAAILQTGFATEDGDLLVQQGIFEIDSIDVVGGLPTKTVEMTGRDHMAWLTTYSQSEQFLNWLPQVIGVDEYADTTGSGYGGMTHSAPAIGSFRAEDGALQLASNNEEGQAENTWLSDNWNGSVESRVSLATVGNDEYIGLIFRSPDKDNGFFFYYHQSSDSLKLDQRLGGEVTTLWSLGSMGRSGDVSPHWLRVTYRYGKITLYNSTDGFQWDYLDTVIVEGQEFVDNPLLQSGYVGSFGRGFSNLDDSFPELEEFPVGELPDNYTAYANPDPDDPTDPTPPDAIYWDYSHGWSNDGGGDNFTITHGMYDHIYGFRSNLNPSLGLEVRRTFGTPFMVHRLLMSTVYWAVDANAVHIRAEFWRAGALVIGYDAYSSHTGNQRGENFDFPDIDYEVDELRLIATQNPSPHGFSEVQFPVYEVLGTGYNPFI